MKHYGSSSLDDSVYQDVGDIREDVTKIMTLFDRLSWCRNLFVTRVLLPIFSAISRNQKNNYRVFSMKNQIGKCS